MDPTDPFVTQSWIMLDQQMPSGLAQLFFIFLTVYVLSWYAMISHKGKTRTVGRFRCFIPHGLWMHCFICRRAVPIADWTKTPKKMQRLTRDRVSVFFSAEEMAFWPLFHRALLDAVEKNSKDFSFGSEEKLREREIPFPVLTHKDREEHLLSLSVLRFGFCASKTWGHQKVIKDYDYSESVSNCQDVLFWISTNHRGIGWRLSQQSGDHVEIHHFNFCLKLRFEFSRSAPHAWPMGTQKFPHPGTQEYLGTAAQGGEQLFSPYFLHHVYRWLSWCLIFCEFLLEQKDVWNLIWKKLLWDDVRIFFDLLETFI